MHHDPDPFAFFVACARKANAQGWVRSFIAELLAERRELRSGRELKGSVDLRDIRAGADWEHTLHHGIARSRLFLTIIRGAPKA